jgi:UDP-N-acetylglucosamine diphosphorylase/glucosamine-1-phosphate N-acetyltransferase
MNYILFDDSSWDNLLPLTFTRPVAEIRIGILKISEKWGKMLNTTISFLTQDYLTCKYPLLSSSDNILINGSILPVAKLIHEIHTLKAGQMLKCDNVIVAARLNAEQFNDFKAGNIDKFENKITSVTITKIEYPWNIFSLNGTALSEDFQFLTKERTSASTSNTNKVAGAENIFIEEGSIIECSILNAKTGPIYVGKDAEIMEGCVVRGPLALCEHATLKMGAKVYGATTIGPHSKVGGEVNNSVIFGFSNKAHDGFLGNSYVGSWVNLGAGTENSNLKNTYKTIKVDINGKEVNSGSIFVGAAIGDHTKTGIKTMFNSGTTVGFCGNLYDTGFHRKTIPSFVWGSPDNYAEYELEKASATAKAVMQRREVPFNVAQERLFKKIFDLTKDDRKTAKIQ